MKTKILLLISIVILSYSNNLKAQWTHIGYGATVQSILVTGSYPSNIIYTGLPNSAVGVYYTANYGATWNGDAIAWYPNYGIVYSIIQSGSQIMAGTDYGINVSSNIYLTSWTHLYASGIPNSIEVYSFATSGGIIYAGAQCGVYSTSDNGSSWDNILFFSPTNNVYSLAISGSKIFAGTSDGVYFSSNNGGNWTIVNNGLPTSVTVNSIAISGSKIFIGTTSGVFYSTNNGSNWVSASTGITNNDITAIAISGTKIFASTNGGGVFVSTNSGSSWTTFNAGFSGGADYYVLSLVINGSWIYAGTGGDGTWMRSTSSLDGIKEIGVENPLIIVYPNPATNNITIESQQQAVIEISNIEGQLIKTLATNSNKTNVDISALPSGIYYVKVKTEKRMIVEKFVKE
ncbi:MAG: T9SS type A sorting domain-containing protein [Bacteroidales bacterium]